MPLVREAYTRWDTVGVPKVRETPAVKKPRRSSVRIAYDVLRLVDECGGKPTRLMLRVNTDYAMLKLHLARLSGAGLVIVRFTTASERMEDSKCKQRVELTVEGRRVLRDLEALDRRTGGILLEW